MCGICGVLNLDDHESVDPSILKRMTDILAHRGPDDEGFYVERNVGLGFRRLSIVDLSAGHQPMSNEDGTLWVVFNGEIYNHVEIRKNLISRGHTYRTNSDTETILHLYEEEGIAGFQRVIGMFAIALWDVREQRLLLIRDRLGIKPLHYALSKGLLVFASEVKSLLQHPSVSTSLNNQVLEEQLTFRFVAGDKSLFSGVSNLLPGHILTCHKGKVSIAQFWDICVPESYLDMDEPCAVVELEERLRDSVKLRLMSDVPLGTFCSGGVDSGLVTAFAREEGNSELNTFSVGFHEAAWDESPYARLVSQRFNTRHHVIKIDNTTYADFLPQLIWYHDEPLFHPSSVLIYHISRLARQFVTVVLTGEGADEIFGGYPRFIVARTRAQLQLMPLIIRRGLASLLTQTGSRKLGKLSNSLPLTLSDTVLYNSAYAWPEQVRDLLTEICSDDFQSYRDLVLSRTKLTRHNLVPATMYQDLKVYIPSLLHRLDKMTMAASIEGRVPFLDHRLVEWGIRVPMPLKIKGLQNKVIVKTLAEKLMPREAIYRQKSGFGVPLSEWFRDPKGMGRYLKLFNQQVYDTRDYIRADRVRNLVSQHLSAKYNHSEILWNLVNLELWHRIFIDKSISISKLKDPRHLAGR